ncbi:MAG: hypothetical protein IPK82_42170 [Polyangiaceae bacterium]|nr:hypothetical protein [Polyangiaceae bacterium]
MTPRIDLEELARRESEQTEWKETVADINDVVATLSAFANDLQNLGGGYVVCGAKEEKDAHGFPKLVRVGLTASRLKELENTVLARCRERVSPPIAPLVEELPADSPDKRILVFLQPATGSAHSFRAGSDGAKHFVRVSRATLEARNGLLRDLLVRKGAMAPWDEQPCAGATVEDVDLLALRDALQRMGLSPPGGHVERFLSSEDALSPFLPPLCAREPLTNTLRPRNFTMILFGAEPQRFVRSAVSVMSVYPGKDRSSKTARRLDFAGTILHQFRELWRELQVRAATVFDKANLQKPNLEVYPPAALLEALVNAVVHRDYSAGDPTRVTVFSDRIEILSPGPLPTGVSLTQLRRGVAAPKWRNRSLAWFFRKLDLAQAEGQGVTTIRTAMKAAGCPPPRFMASEADVMCTLRANARAVELNGGTGKTASGQRLTRNVSSGRTARGKGRK